MINTPRLSPVSVCNPVGYDVLISRSRVEVPQHDVTTHRSTT